MAQVASEIDWLHVDIMDAHFVPNLTIGPPVVESLRKHTGVFFDCHLMMTNPGDYLEAFRKAGQRLYRARRSRRFEPNFWPRRKLGLHAGLAINPETPYEAIDPFLDRADLVLVMTVHPGFGGQGFIEEVVPKIARVRRELDQRGLAADLEVDGGIDEETAPIVVRAGPRVLVAGSAIFGAPSHGKPPAGSVRLEKRRCRGGP